MTQSSHFDFQCILFCEERKERYSSTVTEHFAEKMCWSQRTLQSFGFTGILSTDAEIVT